MRIVLIEPQSPDFHVFSAFALPRLGLPLLGTILRDQGHEVKIFCEDLSPLVWDDVVKADLVGISSITATAPNAYGLGDRIRNQGIPVVMGGVHPTFLPEEALEHSDYVIRGEGEDAIVELIEVLNGQRDRASVQNLSYMDGDTAVHQPMRPQLTDLDALPFPDLTLIDGHDRIKITPIVTSRGCPYDCTFCSVTPMFGRGYRFRSPENVLAELEEKKPAVVFFYDDMFNAIRPRMHGILQGMIDRGIKTEWTAQVRTNIVKHKGQEDVEGLELMKKSGCTFLYIGFESVNPETLKAFNKGQDVDDIIESIRLIHKYDMKIHGMFVLGSDLDDADTVKATADFAIKNKIDTVQFMILTPLPGSKDFHKLDDAGRIFNKNWRLYNAHHVVYWPTKISAWALQSEVFKAMRRFYSIRQIAYLFFTRRFRQLFYRVYGRVVIGRWQKNNRHRLDELKAFVNSIPGNLGQVPGAIREKLPELPMQQESPSEADSRTS